MKIFLGLLVLCTTSGAYADSKGWYAVDSHLCSNGEIYRADHSAERVRHRFKISDDLGQLSVETKKSERAQTLSYTLTKTGKNTFIASPQTPSGDTKYFFVSPSEDRSQLLIYTIDPAGKICGGAAIVTLVVKSS